MVVYMELKNRTTAAVVKVAVTGAPDWMRPNNAVELFRKGYCRMYPKKNWDLKDSCSFYDGEWEDLYALDADNGYGPFAYDLSVRWERIPGVKEREKNLLHSR